MGGIHQKKESMGGFLVVRTSLFPYWNSGIPIFTSRVETLRGRDEVSKRTVEAFSFSLFSPLSVAFVSPFTSLSMIVLSCITVIKKLIKLSFMSLSNYKILRNKMICKNKYEKINIILSIYVKPVAELKKFSMKNQTKYILKNHEYIFRFKYDMIQDIRDIPIN
jgi:hypothetical protein